MTTPKSTADRRRSLRRKAHADRRARPPSPRRAFRKRPAPDDLQRGLFTLFLDDDEGLHACQVWAGTPSAAASMVAPWAKDRLRAARREEEVDVELVGWDSHEVAGELSKASGIAEEELDPGLCYGVELTHVWFAEHEEDGHKSRLYVIETIGFDHGITDAPDR